MNVTTRDTDDLTALMAGIGTGDVTAWAELYRARKDSLMRTAMHLLGNSALAEELVQDIFVELWHKSGDYDATCGSVDGWLNSICRHRAIDRIRERSRSQARDLHYAVPLHLTRLAIPLEDMAEERLAARRIHEALAGLSEKQREAIRLNFYAGYSHAEIADDLGIALGTVKSRIREGLAAMRRRLAA